MPFLSMPTPAAIVPSVNVPSPSFQNSRLVRKSAAIVSSGNPSSFRSVNDGENEYTPGAWLPTSSQTSSTFTPAELVTSTKCPGAKSPRLRRSRECDGMAPSAASVRHSPT